jgi:hypothetical protein
VGRYLDLLRACDQSDKSDQAAPRGCERADKHKLDDGFGRLGRFGRNQLPYQRALEKLEARLPKHVIVAAWEQAVDDARAFLATWGPQAEALGWTAGDLFRLAPVPSKPAVTYQRLSRYDQTGLIWLLRGRSVIALTESTAIMGAPSGARLTYFRVPLFERASDVGLT